MKIGVKHCISLLLIAVLILSSCARSPVLSRTDVELLSREELTGISGKESMYFKDGEYVIQNGDVILVNVLKNKEFSDTVTIRPDGKITLPALGDLQAAGLTLEELSNEVTKRLSDRLKEPEVSVVLREEKPKLVYVLGEVQNERAYPLNISLTPLQAIVNAGGFTKIANKKRVLLLRDFQKGRYRMVILDMTKPGVKPGLKLQNIKLRPNDILVVEKSGIGKFNEWVEQYLGKPLGHLLVIPNTILQLIILNKVTD